MSHKPSAPLWRTAADAPAADNAHHLHQLFLSDHLYFEKESGTQQAALDTYHRSYMPRHKALLLPLLPAVSCPVPSRQGGLLHDCQASACAFQSVLKRPGTYLQRPCMPCPPQEVPLPSFLPDSGCPLPAWGGSACSGAGAGAALGGAGGAGFSRSCNRVNAQA